MDVGDFLELWEVLSVDSCHFPICQSFLSAIKRGFWSQWMIHGANVFGSNKPSWRAEALKKPMKPECSRKQLPKMCGLPTGEFHQRGNGHLKKVVAGVGVCFGVGFAPGIPQDLCYINYICVYIAILAQAIWLKSLCYEASLAFLICCKLRVFM